LTEVETTANIKFSMQDYTANNHRQQWKIVNNLASAGSVNFVNRATGNLISAVPVYDIYNYVQYAATETNGWQIDSLGNNQYQVRTGPTGTEKYWNAATAGEAQDNYPKNTVLNTGFAWKFHLVDDGIYSAIDLPEYDNLRVLVKDRRIHVEGSAQYRIYTIQGISVNKNSELPSGIYLVTIKNKTVKVLVK
jgi:hypothetical protein